MAAPIPTNARRGYRLHKANARYRGIPWEFSFEEWWAVWEASGKWAERGRGSGQYVMARLNDCGPYAAKNVRIITMNENIREGWTVGAAGSALRCLTPRTKGWRYRPHDCKEKPYQAYIGPKYIGVFATAAEATAAHRAAWAARLAATSK